MLTYRTNFAAPSPCVQGTFLYLTRITQIDKSCFVTWCQLRHQHALWNSRHPASMNAASLPGLACPRPPRHHQNPGWPRHSQRHRLEPGEKATMIVACMWPDDNLWEKSETLHFHTCPGPPPNPPSLFWHLWRKWMILLPSTSETISALCPLSISSRECRIQ